MIQIIKHIFDLNPNQQSLMKKYLQPLKTANKHIRLFSQQNDPFQQGTELCKLAFLGDIDQIKNLIENENYNVNSYDVDFRTPLHIASAEGQVECCQYLISKGAVLIQDTFGNIPVHDAKYSLNLELINILNQVPIRCNDKFQKDHQFIDKMRFVLDAILKTGIFNFSVITSQIQFYFNDLHIDDKYFKILDAGIIKNHVLGLMMAQQVENLAQQQHGLLMPSDQSDQPFILSSSNNLDKAFDYLNLRIGEIDSNQALKVQHHTSNGVYRIDQKQNLEILQIINDSYINKDGTNFRDITTQQFLKNPKQVIDQYEKIVNKASQSAQPQIEIFEHDKETIVLMANHFRQTDPNESSKFVSHTQNLSALSCVFKEIGLSSNYRIMDTFANGIRVSAFYLQKQPSEEQLLELRQKANIILMVKPFLQNYLIQGQVNVMQFFYLDSVYNFTKFFLEIKNEDIDYLQNVLKSNMNQLQKLESLNSKNNLDLKQNIHQVIQNNLSTIKLIFQHFELKLKQKDTSKIDELIKSEIKKCKSVIQKEMMQTFMKFNNSILKTNFYTTEKSAACYYLDPKQFLEKFFLSDLKFTLVMIKSKDFQGFQVNFGDVYRGNLTIIKNIPHLKGNIKSTFFNDTFRDALKQHELNKNIPESGCQTNLILHEGRNQFTQLVYDSFQQTINQFLNKQQGIIDLVNRHQIQFCQSLKIDNKGHITNMQKNLIFSDQIQKNYQIQPLDQFEHRFSQISLQEFIRGVQNKNDIKPEDSTAFIVGGPSGKLAQGYYQSAQEKIIGIIDQTGVLYDPQGIDKKALQKLINNKGDVEQFDGEVSQSGFKHILTDENITTFDGNFFTTGLQLRNNLYRIDIKADFLIVLGGQKNTINLNVAQQLAQNDKKKFKTIIEASDSYFSNNAVEHLINNNVTIFQNQSTQMGPIVSGSLEYLLFNSLTQREYESLVEKKKGKYSKQFQAYIDDITNRIQINSKIEFEYLWKKQRQGQYQNSTIQLSQKITDLQEMIMDSNLFENDKIKEKVFSSYIPQSLKDLVSFEDLCQRIPLIYQKQMFGNIIATEYYLNNDKLENIYEFYQFMNKYEKE